MFFDHQQSVRLVKEYVTRVLILLIFPWINVILIRRPWWYTKRVACKLDIWSMNETQIDNYRHTFCDRVEENVYPI